MMIEQVLEHTYARASFVVPGSLTILTTSNCTAKCAHCLVSSGPDRSETLTYDEIVELIDEAHRASPLSVVVFAGGEPTSLDEVLLDAIAYVNGLGIGTRIVTNASWATDDRVARQMVTQLREAGLDEINFSADDFHLPWIPVDNVVTAWRACKGAGFQSVVIALCSGPRSKLTPEVLMERLGEEVELTFDDDGNCTKLPAPGADGTRYLIANNNVYRIGRGRHLREDYCTFPEHQSGLARRCAWAIQSAAVSPENHLVACCGIEAEDNPVLDFGLLAGTRVIDLIDRANSDPLVSAISVLGPRYLMDKATNLDPRLKFRPRYAAACEICEDVTTNTDAVKVLRDHSSEICADVATARVLRSLVAQA
jgi:Radical SAM superfamily/4Fe-4S single cluster domain